MLGSQGITTIVLVLIVYMLTGLIRDCITIAKLDNREALPMKTKTMVVIPCDPSTAGLNLLFFILYHKV